MTQAGRWRLTAADARLTGPGVEASLERRTAALLVYLALSGAAPRSRLAGLLYPEAPEGRARNNLAQLVRRLHRLTGEPLVGGDGVLDLAPTVQVEPEKDAGGSLLLGPFGFADLPEFEAWLLAQRERLAGARRIEMSRLATEAEREGQYAEAAGQVETLLELDPLSEDAWCRLMRLRYLTGNREGALDAFRECRRVLREHLSTGPLPETLRLAAELERGDDTPKPPFPPGDTGPARPTPLCPPVLVGRRREWAQLEEAWARGQVIVISGPPGIGKTRLARDFAASRGPYAFQEARPGDAPLPYTAAARNLRRIIRQYPEAAADPEVRRELSRIVPELGDGEAPPEPVRHDTDRLRFFAAAARVLQHEAFHVASTVDDDSQYYDRASRELGIFIFAQAAEHAPPGARPRLIFTCRTDEWPEEFRVGFDRLCAQELGFHLELGPLPADEVGALVASLGLEGAAPDVGALADAAGGNPFFVLETLGHLAGPGNRPGVPGDGTVQELISTRLERLSPPALLTARAAGALQSDFDAETVAEVMQAPLMTVAEAWKELEAARVLVGHRFAHDLVYEAVLAGIPGAVRRMLHRGAARALEGRGAAPARIARHWLQGEEPAQAAPWLLRAAAQAVHAGRPGEALGYYDEAERLYGDFGVGDPGGLAEVRRGRAALGEPAATGKAAPRG